MKAYLTTLPLLALLLLSCDKAKKIADKASSVVSKEISRNIGAGESAEADEALRKLVDQTEDGVIFRKDLPFPPHLEVRTTCRREMSGRVFHSSEIEKRAETVDGTQVSVTRLERSGDQVRYTSEQSSFSVPSADDPENQQRKVANPLEQVAPSTRPVTFIRSGKTWTSDERDGFRAAVLSKQLAPVFDELLIENALAPRTLWFAKRRIRIGGELDVAGDSVPMLVAGRAKGSLHLKLEAIEPVNGHPCGVFSVTGDYTRKQFPDFEGDLTDQEVTIESGKLWLSLLYPVILKEELNTIQSFRAGGQGGLSGRGQGTIKVTVTRDWKPVVP